MSPNRHFHHQHARMAQHMSEAPEAANRIHPGRQKGHTGTQTSPSPQRSPAHAPASASSPRSRSSRVTCPRLVCVLRSPTRPVLGAARHAVVRNCPIVWKLIWAQAPSQEPDPGASETSGPLTPVPSWPQMQTRPSASRAAFAGCSLRWVQPSLGAAVVGRAPHLRSPVWLPCCHSFFYLCPRSSRTNDTLDK